MKFPVKNAFEVSAELIKIYPGFGSTIQVLVTDQIGGSNFDEYQALRVILFKSGKMEGMIFLSKNENNFPYLVAPAIPYESSCFYETNLTAIIKRLNLVPTQLVGV